MTEKKPLLKVEQLKVHFHTEHGTATAVDGVDLVIHEGEIVGVVGESGCGKSVMSQSILRLLEYTDTVSYEGRMLFGGNDILKFNKKQLQHLRGNQIAMVFQEPMMSLNPVYTIGNQLEEAVRIHRKGSKKEARGRALELLRRTGIDEPERCAGQYPHELSGGMQQRVMIAIALAGEPKLLIADEPTTALDVTIQAQIIRLLLRLNRELGMAVLFISHDLGVIGQICGSVKVMYLGQMIEEAPGNILLKDPLHPYTQGLIASIPRPEIEPKSILPAIAGIVPSLSDIPKGCRFATRCPYADRQCELEEPAVYYIADQKRSVKCRYYKEIQSGMKEGADHE